jgi:hypothetical protein
MVPIVLVREPGAITSLQNTMNKDDATIVDIN